MRVLLTSQDITPRIALVLGTAGSCQSSAQQVRGDLPDSVQNLGFCRSVSNTGMNLKERTGRPGEKKTLNHFIFDLIGSHDLARFPL